MLHYVHQLVANFVYLTFDAGQVGTVGFLNFFPQKRLVAMPGNDGKESSETEPKTVKCVKPKQQAKRC